MDNAFSTVHLASLESQGSQSPCWPFYVPAYHPTQDLSDSHSGPTWSLKIILYNFFTTGRPFGSSASGPQSWLISDIHISGMTSYFKTTDFKAI